MSLKTCLTFEIVITLMGELFPLQIVRLFTTPTKGVLALAPGMIRLYFITFLFMGMSVLSIYVLQSLVQGTRSMLLSVMRGCALSALFLFLFPLFSGLYGVCLAQPTTELITSFLGIYLVQKAK